MRLQLNIFLFAPLLWACGSDNAVVSLEGEGEEPGTEEPGSEQPGTEQPGTEEPVDPYEGATLEIISPAANSLALAALPRAACQNPKQAANICLEDLFCQHG